MSEDRFEYWNQIVEGAASDNGARDSRHLFYTLVRCLQTEQEADFLSHPAVRKFIAERIEAALESKRDGVSKALGITNSVKSGRSHFEIVRRDFIRMVCLFMANHDGDKPDDILINEWLIEATNNDYLVRKKRNALLDEGSSSADIEEKCYPSYDTTRMWVLEAGKEYKNPTSSFHVYKNISTRSR